MLAFCADDKHQTLVWKASYRQQTDHPFAVWSVSFSFTDKVLIEEPLGDSRTIKNPKEPFVEQEIPLALR